MTRGGLLLLAVWFGMAAGVLELLVIGHRRFVLGHITHVSAHVVWMAPTANVLLFTAAATPLLLLAAVRSRPPSFRVIVFLFSFLAVLALLFMPEGFHPIAILLLAAGVASRLAGVAARRPSSTTEIARRSLLPLVLLVAGLAALVVGRRALEERAALGSLRPAAADAPNVLLLILDTVRAKSLSLYGYERSTTPRLEEWAGRGVVFERAIATAPWTLPSHASLFTGRFPHELSTGFESPLDDSHPTLAEALSRHGYVTAGFVANHVYTSRIHGLDRGFIHYEDLPLSLGQLVLSASLGRRAATSTWLRNLLGRHELLNRKPAGRVNRDLLRWLDREERRPFFAFVNYFDAHEPYLPPEPFDRAFGPAKSRGPLHHWGSLRAPNEAIRPRKWTLTKEEMQTDLDAYEGAIAYVDQEVGNLLDELQARGELENTVVIVTSDHGEQHGEHGLFDHVNSLYMPLLHVPLLVFHPGRVPEKTRIPAAVSLRNIPATVLELVGIDSTVFPGRSLSRLWRGTRQAENEPDTVLSELRPGRVEQAWYPVARGAMASLVADGFHYIRYADGTEELYDLAADPEQVRDLSPSAEHAPDLVRLRLLLRTTRGTLPGEGIR